MIFSMKGKLSFIIPKQCPENTMWVLKTSAAARYLCM